MVVRRVALLGLGGACCWAGADGDASLHKEVSCNAPGVALAAGTLDARIEAALLGALVSDACTSSGAADTLGNTQQLPSGFWEQSESGGDLLNALEVISAQGFEFHTFANAWQSWAGNYSGNQGPGIREALQNMKASTTAEASGSHYIDLGGAARVLSLLLLAESVEDNALALASREAQLISHENPKSLQVGEFLLRAALHQLRSGGSRCSREERRSAMAEAFHAAADKAGMQFHSVIEEALAEAQSRESISRELRKAGGSGSGSLADWHSDRAVLGRLTSSGDALGEELEGGKTSFMAPAIIWFSLAYDTLHDALSANSKLGGESALRAIFIGLLLAANIGPGSIPATWAERLPMQPRLRSSLPPFVEPLRLCDVPGMCRGSDAWRGERQMHGVVTEASIVLMEARASKLRYRVFVHIDATSLISLLPSEGAMSKPADWEDDEDGPWEPPEQGPVVCLARYFQFSTASGRHAPFGVWPAHAMCRLTLDAPIAHDSFDVVLPEAITYVIGGLVLGPAGQDVKLPRLATSQHAEAPSWAERCDHVGMVKLPEGTWQISS